MTESKTKKPKSITLRVPAELHQAVKRKLASGESGEDEKWQPLLLGLLRQWLGDEVAPAAPAVSIKHQAMVDKLLYILRSGQDDAIKAVTENILVFERYTKLQDLK